MFDIPSSEHLELTEPIKGINDIYYLFTPSNKKLEIRNILFEAYVELTNEKITKGFIKHRIKMANEKNSNLFSNKKENFFFNLVQECYLKLISYNPSLDHTSLKDLIEMMVIDYFSENKFRSTNSDKIAEEIFRSQIEPLVKFADSSRYQMVSSDTQKSKKKEVSDFGNLVADAKDLVDNEKYKDRIKIANDYSLPSILILMYFDEEYFIQLIENNDGVKELFTESNLFENEYKRTLLHQAVSKGQYDIIDKILKVFDLSELDNLAKCQDEYGRTALHIAAIKGDVKIFKLLFESGYFDLSTQDSYGRTALHLVAGRDQLEIIEFLLDKKSDLIDSKDKFGRTAGHLAAINNQFEIVEFFLNKKPEMNFYKDSHDKTLIHLAATNNKPDVVRKCIEAANKEIDKLLDVVDSNGNTPFHLAAKSCSIDVLELLGYEYLNVEQVNKKDKYGSTALHHAAYWKHVEAIDVLIESGADLSIEDKYKCCPLIVAAKFNKNAENSSILKHSKLIISKLINYDYSIFVLPLGKFSDALISDIFKKQSKYLNIECESFIKDLYKFLKSNPDVFKPLKASEQDHIPLVTKAVEASNKELIQKIMDNFPELLFLSELQKGKLEESIINNPLYKSNDSVLTELYNKLEFDEIKKTNPSLSEKLTNTDLARKIIDNWVKVYESIKAGKIEYTIKELILDKNSFNSEILIFISRITSFLKANQIFIDNEEDKLIISALKNSNLMLSGIINRFKEFIWCLNEKEKKQINTFIDDNIEKVMSCSDDDLLVLEKIGIKVKNVKIQKEEYESKKKSFEMINACKEGNIEYIKKHFVLDKKYNDSCIFSIICSKNIKENDKWELLLYLKSKKNLDLLDYNCVVYAVNNKCYNLVKNIFKEYNQKKTIQKLNDIFAENLLFFDLAENGESDLVKSILEMNATLDLDTKELLEDIELSGEMKELLFPTTI